MRVEERIRIALAALTAADGIELAFAIDRDGRLIAVSGDSDALDTTTLAGLVDREVEAFGGIAAVFRHRGFTTRFVPDREHHVHVQLVANRLLIVVIFGAAASLGLVLVGVKTAATTFADSLDAFPELDDDDLDTLLH